MDNLIGMKEMARMLGISVKALRIRVSKGKIDQPVKRVGDELFWHRDTEHLGTIGCTESLNIDDFRTRHPEMEADVMVGIDDGTSDQHTFQMHILKARQPVMDNDVKSIIQPLGTSLALGATEEQIQAAVDAGFISKEQHEIYLQRGTVADFDSSVMDKLTTGNLIYALPTDGLRRDEAVVLSAPSSKDKTVLPQSDVPEEHLHAIIYSTKHLIQDVSGERKQHTGYRRGVRNQRLTKKARG